MAHKEFEPGVYVKGEVEKWAGSAARAVELVFDGFKRREESSEAPQARGVAPEPIVQEHNVPEPPIVEAVAPTEQNSEPQQ